jgi:hypothetical protein
VGFKHILNILYIIEIVERFVSAQKIVSRLNVLQIAFSVLSRISSDLFYLRTKEDPQFYPCSADLWKLLHSCRKMYPVLLMAFVNFSSVQTAREVEEDKSSVDVQVGHLEHSFPQEKKNCLWPDLSLTA